MRQDDISTCCEAILMGLEVIASCLEVISVDLMAIVTSCEAIRMGWLVY